MARVYKIRLAAVTWRLHDGDAFNAKVKALTDVGVGEFMSCTFEDVGECPEQKAARLLALTEKQSSEIVAWRREVERLRNASKPKRKKATT